MRSGATPTPQFGDLEGGDAPSDHEPAGPSVFAAGELGTLFWGPWCDGVFETNGEAVTGATPGMTGGIVRRKAERVFLELLDKLESEGRYVSENTNSPNYAPKVFASRPERDGIRKADFKGAMERLLSEGRIEVATYARNRHEYPRIARKDAK